MPTNSVPRVFKRMNADDAATTMWAYACMQWCPKEEREPLMHAASRVYNRTTSQTVACIL
jgi:hypothetical protein